MFPHLLIINSSYGSMMRSAVISFAGRATNTSIQRHSGCFCRWGECRRIFPDELLHTQWLLPRQCAHVVRRPVEAPRAMQIAQRREVVHHVNRPAPIEQGVPPGLDGNVLISNRAAQRLRILLGKEMHALGL